MIMNPACELLLDLGQRRLNLDLRDILGGPALRVHDTKSSTKF